MKKLIIFSLLTISICGCNLGWGGGSDNDKNNSDRQPEKVFDDAIEATATGAVVSINDDNTVDIELSDGSGVIVTAPNLIDNPVELDDVITVRLFFEGSDVDNEWFLIEAEI